ncbi:hypothetical protein KI688_007747 [Linnemannia hyalina]|uniref:Uncharacterized protein n=1 Tax=Linnemannia hyalina TaxID=64524 RepID=A0A9P8BMI8_9FUNG|nr:hypothetical protein KI688_007747 [Linnemannia hyalina]
MAAQPASTNDRRITRLSISTTTTTLTPSTKAYATPPTSRTIPSSSSTSAVASALVEFASLAVEVPRSPQQQEVALQTAERCSQNASQSAELRSVIVTRSTEHRSLTAAQLTEPRPRASTRSPRTNRRDDEKQQDSRKSGTKVPSDSVDRLVKGIGAVQIHQASASRHSQTTSPPIPATPTNQKRGRSDYEQENSIEERLAKLYVGPLPPTSTLTSASASASTSTPPVTPLSTTTTAMTICTSMSHNRPAKTSPKGNERSESQLKPWMDSLDIALHTLRAARKLVVAALACDSHRRHDIYMQCEYAHTQYTHEHIQYLSVQLTNPARIEYQRRYEQARFEYLQMYEQMMDESQQKFEPSMTEAQRRYENAWIEFQRQYEKEWINWNRGYDKAWAESQRKYEKAWIEFQRKYDMVVIESQRRYEKAWIDCQRRYDKSWTEFQRMYDKAWIKSQRNYKNEWHEFQRKCRQATMESQQKYKQAITESQRKYVQASEHRKKSIQDARNKPAQQHQQVSQSYHQTSPQHKQGLEEVDDKSSRPLLSKDADTVPSSLPESESSGSREDGDKTSEGHGRRRKRVKHDDIKKEPVDETMSDAATASASFSTITSTASTTSSFSTSSGHTVADVTLDMQNKLNFNPTTAIFQ